MYSVAGGRAVIVVCCSPVTSALLVIADITHGYNIQNIGYDTEPYTYQAFNKVVMGFIEVTTSPFWIFIAFHIDTQQLLV